MTSYVNPFTGQTISPSSISYESITISSNTTLQWPINGNTNTPISSILDVTATTTGLAILLPPATQVSTGQSVLVRNIGSNPFNVFDNNGGSIVTVLSGVSQFIWLTDNTTVQGIWAAVTFGASTTSANAAQLAGYGLAASGLTLNENNPVTFINSTPFTINSTYQSSFLVWNTGAGVINLPSSALVGNGWSCMIANDGSGIVTITPSGTDTINSNSTQQLQLTESLVIVSNGASGWNTYGYGRSNTFAYTQLALTVTGGSLTLTSPQAANTIQTYSGTLTSNQTVYLPSTVQLYSITNNTTGSYTLSFRTVASGGAILPINPNQSVIAICDGTNVYNANTYSAGSYTNTSITLAPGSAATPTFNYVGDLTTGFYQPTSGQVGVTISGSNVATFSSTGLVVPLGINGGSF